MAIKQEYMRDGSFIRHYSDSGKTLLQIETGIEYDEAIDVVPCKYTYNETENAIAEREIATEADYQEALERLGVDFND